MQGQRIKEMEEHQRQSIKRDDAKKLYEMNDKLESELTETRAAMLSYKNMNHTMEDQVKGLKLMIERRKDENDNLLNAMRELQGKGENEKRLGNLYYLVMLSRW